MRITASPALTILTCSVLLLSSCNIAVPDMGSVPDPAVTVTSLDDRPGESSVEDTALTDDTAPLQALAAGRYAMPRDCVWVKTVNGKRISETCLQAGLMNNTQYSVQMKRGRIPFANLTHYCTTNRDECAQKAKSHFQWIYNHTRPGFQCRAARNELAIANNRLSFLKLGIVVGATSLVAGTNHYVGVRMKDASVWLNTGRVTAAAAIGLLLGEWAGNWLYTPYLTDSGASITAKLVVISLEAMINLPHYMGLAGNTNPAPFMAQNCIPNPGAIPAALDNV